MRERLAAAGTANPDGVRFLLSAHASHEELFLFRRLAEELVGHAEPISVSWRYRPKSQPDGAKFKVPPVDAPNVNGARLFGLVNGNVADAVGEADLSALKEAVALGPGVGALRVRPGPGRHARRRRRGLSRLGRAARCRCSIVQGVLLSELARAADFVLPGASFVEKEASYTNDQGRLQGAARVIPAPGEAMEDWQILVTLASELGVSFDYAERRARFAPTSPHDTRSGRNWRVCRRWPSRESSRQVTGCRRRIRRSAGSGMSCSRTCRRSRARSSRARCRRRPGVIPLREVKT